MGLDHVGSGEGAVETVDQQPPPPPDQPGAEGVPSRADSRAAAATDVRSVQASDEPAEDNAGEQKSTTSADSVPEENADGRDGGSDQDRHGAGEDSGEASAEEPEARRSANEELSELNTDDSDESPRVSATAEVSQAEPGENPAAVQVDPVTEAEPPAQSIGSEQPSVTEGDTSNEVDAVEDTDDPDLTAPSVDEGETGTEQEPDDKGSDEDEVSGTGDLQDVPDHQSAGDDGTDEQQDGDHLRRDDAAPEALEPGMDRETDRIGPGPVEPLTDAEYADHVRDVADKLGEARAQRRTTDQVYTVDPDQTIWSAERRQVHNEILDDLYGRASEVPNDREAVIAGGLGGAGKSTVLENYAGIEQSQFLTINPDDIKQELARRDLVPQVEGLSPMEASDLVHEESSHLAKRLARQAQSDGKNVVWDITMSSQESTEKRIEALREAGYRNVRGVFVDIPVEMSVARAQARHRRGLEDYRNGQGDGGRYVPPEVIRANTDPEWGSMNRRTFEQVKGRFDEWSVYDNSVEGRAPVLVDSGEREDEER